MVSAGSTGNNLYLGIDLGTSGCRTIVVNEAGNDVANHAIPWPIVAQTPGLWWQGIETLLGGLSATVPVARIKAICVDGTSGTVFFTSHDSGAPIGPVLMYNDNRATAEAEYLKTIAPPDSPVLSATSGLAKLLWLKSHHDIPLLSHFHHQADWVYGKLSGSFLYSDVNNVLKSGYDPITRHWSSWMPELDLHAGWFPEVVTPGTPIGTLTPVLAEQFGFSPETLIMAGTTDSTAAFIATGANRPGDAVTSLGSTLVLKVISDKPVFDAAAGIYSQPLGDRWLAGGASNSGGRVLREFFSDDEMETLSEQLDFKTPTGLDYYPLPQTGERFPVNDPNKPPLLTPRPEDPARFFQALLEGIARIEQTGYRRLAEAGAPYPTSVRSVGGGAVNQAWTKYRGKLLNVPMLAAANTDAAYGAALLARDNYHNRT